MAYNFVQSDTVPIRDFTGGINITDPAPSLPGNTMTTMQDFVLSRQGVLTSRPPYRPETFSGNPDDYPILSGGNSPDKVLDMKAVACSETNWNYLGTLHVVAALFGSTIKVLAFNTSTLVWTEIGSFSNSSEISIVPYKLNEAIDILMFPNADDMQRWPVGGSASNMGLTKPAVDDFTVTFTQGTEGNITLVTSQKLYYRFSYFYDDDNDTTKYGESEVVAVTTDTLSVFTAGSDAPSASVEIDFGMVTNLDPGIKYIYIYRSVVPEGPFRYIDRVAVVHDDDGSSGDDGSSDEITDYVDTTPIDFEGSETVIEGADPKVASLRLKNVMVSGSQLYGFDVSLPYKMFRSKSGQPDVWDPLDFDYLDADGEGVVDFNRKLYAFSKKSCYEKETADSPAVKVSKVGCVDGRSIQNVGRGVCWMDYDTVYFADFVTAYDSEGGFPLDIGHPISKAVIDLSTSKSVNSMFKDQRYHLSFTEKQADSASHYVLDVKFRSWTQFSCGHELWDNIGLKYWSVGHSTGTTVATQKWYVYRHDYNEVIGDPYTGRDYHDYNSILSSAYAERKDIPLLVGRDRIRFGLNVQKAVLVSAFLEIDGLGAEPVLSIEGGESEYMFNVDFSSIGVEEEPTEYPGLYDQAVYAAGDPFDTYSSDDISSDWSSDEPDSSAGYSSDDEDYVGYNEATAEHAGYVGATPTTLKQYKKINKPLKSSEFKFTLMFGAGRRVELLALDINYRTLPGPA